MATTRFPNRTGQVGVYHTGTPNYVDVDAAFTGQGSFVSFATKAADTSQPGGAWADGELVGVLVFKDASNHQVWRATWDDSNEYLEVETLEDSVGTLTDGDSVLVTAVMTEYTFDSLVSTPQIVPVSGTSHTVGLNERGATFCCTSGSATTITLSEDMPVPYHGVVVQEGTGAVSLVIEGSDTVNGATDPIAIGVQWRSAYFYQRTEGAWVVIT